MTIMMMMTIMIVMLMNTEIAVSFPFPTVGTDSNCVVSSAQRVGFFNIGSGLVLDKIPGSGSGSGRLGVLKYPSGIIGYLFYSRVILGISGISG